MGECASWNSFKEAIMQRFGSPYDDSMGDIKNLRHTGSIEEYQNAFDQLLIRIDLPEDQQVNKQKYRSPLLPTPSVIDHDEEVVHEEVTGEVIEFTPQISLNALNGVESFQTLRVTGHVDIPGRAQLTSKNMCKKFAWKIHEEEFVVDDMLLPLGGCDMVLGVQWLSTLG
nr:hypothetical protein [Tanacetum cinerariifolium]